MYLIPSFVEKVKKVDKVETVNFRTTQPTQSSLSSTTLISFPSTSIEKQAFTSLAEK
jgi:hypothetical protein